MISKKLFAIYEVYEGNHQRIHHIQVGHVITHDAESPYETEIITEGKRFGRLVSLREEPRDEKFALDRERTAEEDTCVA